MQFPGRRPFYKYVAPETVLAILANQTVRYSSPLLFNDPFDHQIGLHLDFDLSQFPLKLLSKLEFLAKHQDIAIVDEDGPARELIMFMREKYPGYGFPAESFADAAKPILAEGARMIEQTRQMFEEYWLNSLQTNRTFCVAEENDNLLMWSHYAKDHSGAVLELWSLPEEDNALSVARQVEYKDKPLSFFSEAEFVDHFCGVGPLDLVALTRRQVHTKSSHWSYEKEWRVYFPLSEKPGLYEDVTLLHTEFTALFFGCRASPGFVKEARRLLAANYPKVRQWAAARQRHAYQLSFGRI